MLAEVLTLQPQPKPALCHSCQIRLAQEHFLGVGVCFQAGGGDTTPPKTLFGDLQCTLGPANLHSPQWSCFCHLPARTWSNWAWSEVCAGHCTEADQRQAFCITSNPMVQKEDNIISPPNWWNASTYLEEIGNTRLRDASTPSSICITFIQDFLMDLTGSCLWPNIYSKILQAIVQTASHRGLIRVVVTKA